jgi:hypothetical protein
VGRDYPEYYALLIFPGGIIAQIGGGVYKILPTVEWKSLTLWVVWSIISIHISSYSLL